MKTASYICGMPVAVLGILAWPVFGQRIEFPTAIPLNTAPAATSGSPYGTAPGNSAGTSPRYGATTAPRYAAGTAPAYGSGTTPSPGTSVAPGYGTAPGPSPGTSAAPSYGTGAPPTYGAGAAPSYGPGLAPGPAATFQGNIQPPTAWDPYATPGSPPATLFPQDPTMPVFPGAPSDTLTTMKRFLQEIRLDYVWIPGTASSEFGVNDAELSAEFAIPFLRNPQTPLLVTPGFAVHYWNGPVNDWQPCPIVPADFQLWGPDLPPRAYDAYLNVAWNPQLNRVLSGELAFRIGVYSDFSEFIRQSIRYQGYGYGIVSLSPSFHLKAGVVYLDRNRYKLLPAGGIIWTPNEDVRFEILFPNPKLALRLPGYSTTEWWLYARGEYGGGSWTVTSNFVEFNVADPANQWSWSELVEVDYNDFRAALGLDFETVRGLKGLCEVGIAFEREIFYPSTGHGAFTYRPDPMVFVRAGLAY